MRPLRRPGIVAPAALVALPFLVYGRFILGAELYNADVFLAYRPAHAWLAEGLRHGRFPLWTDAILGGFPIAFSEYGWFSPLTWLPLLVFGGHAGFYVAVALCVALAGLAAYGLARALGLSLLGAALVGVIYGQSLLVVGGAPLLNQGVAYWALPAALLYVHRAFGGPPWAAPALGVVVGLTLVGSHPQLAVIALAPPAAVAVWRAVAMRTWGTLAQLGIGAALGALVSAVRFLPTLPLVAASERSGGLSLAASAIGSVAPHALLAGLLLPSLNVPRFLTPQWTAYIGALPLALALAARSQSGALRVRWWWVLALVGVVLALGSLTPVFWLLQRTPLLTYFREPSRFLLWTVLALALLAGRGLDRLRASAPDRILRAALRVVVFGVVPFALATGAAVVLRGIESRALAWLYLNTLRQTNVRDYPQEHYAALASGAWHTLVRSFNPLDAGLLVPLLSLLAAALWWSMWRGRRYATAGALVCSVVPLLAYGHVRLPAVPAAVVSEAAEVVAVRPEKDGPMPRVLSWLPLAADFENRVLLQGAGLDADVASYRLLARLQAPNFGLVRGVPQLDGYENLMTREQAVLTAALGSERASTSSTLALTGQRLQERRRLGGERWGLVEAAGVGTVLSVERLQPAFWPGASRFEPAAVRAERGVPSVTAFRMIYPAQRAYVATTWRSAETADEAARLLAQDVVDGLPATVITMEAGSAALPRPRTTSGAAGAGATAEITRYEERLVEVVAMADADALLVLLDAMAPGWRATVTGAPAPILTANVAFRAVQIPAGRHVVRFEYAPPNWGPARGLAAAGTVALVGWLLWVRMGTRGRFTTGR